MNLHHPMRTIALCVAATFLVACSSKVERVQSGLVKGADYVRLADWDKANVEVRNVLQIDPKNAEAYFISGQVAEGKRELQRAFGSYSKALELKPDHIEAKVGLARVYLFAGEVDKSAQAVTEVLAVDARNVGARTMQAALLSRQGKVTEAIAQAQALINEQKNPPVETSMLLAGLYASQGNATAALGVVEAALKADPKNLSLLQVAAQIAGAATDTTLQAKAVGFFRQATEQAPKNNDLWTAWAIHHTRRNELDLAEQVLRASIKAQPDESPRTLALLDFLSARRGKDVAEKEFVAAIASKPKDTTLRFGLVNLYRASDRAADARRVLQEIIDLGKDAPSGLMARNQLAADRLANGKVAEARALVGEVLAVSPRDGAALVMRGRMLLDAGDARNAIIDLRSAAKDQPGSPEVVGLLAQAHRKADEPQLAREVLADAVKFKPDNAELRLLLAADMADAKDYKAAANEIDAAIKAAPLNLRAYDMKAQLALVQKDTASAEKTYAALKTQFPKDPAGSLKLGQLYSDQKKFDAALKEYDEAGRLVPGAPGPMLSAIGILLAQRRFDEAGTRIDALMKREPKNVLPYQLRGEVATARGDLPLAEQSYRKMIEFAPTVPAGYTSLARVKALRNNIGEAITVLEEGERALPDDVSLPAARAEWLARAGRHDDAIAVYESLVKRKPDEDAYANNLAYLLTESKGDKAHLERALSLTSRFKESSNAGYLDSLGWAHYKLGQYAEAVPVLERAVQRSPNAPLLQLHLGMALHKSGDVTRAQEFLKKAIASKVTLPNLDEARLLIAQK
ncbi:MAG: tetratricopeptide repeat protein [Pseudomonadota bacterium]|nr:tetratricopeptide repeat protein [Pseudomonadota bacterium]